MEAAKKSDQESNDAAAVFAAVNGEASPSPILLMFWNRGQNHTATSTSQVQRHRKNSLDWRREDEENNTRNQAVGSGKTQQHEEGQSVIRCNDYIWVCQCGVPRVTATTRLCQSLWPIFITTTTPAPSFAPRSSLHPLPPGYLILPCPLPHPPSGSPFSVAFLPFPVLFFY